MITGVLIGDKALIERFRRLPDAARKAVDDTVMRLGYRLKAEVQSNWLRGPRPQKLGVRTGRLLNSIVTRFEFTAQKSIAYVGTNVSYGRVWEVTGIPARTIVPVKAKALRFEIDGQVLFRKKVTIPAIAPRPFLKPALEQLKPVILSDLTQALKTVAQETLRA